MKQLRLTRVLSIGLLVVIFLVGGAHVFTHLRFQASLDAYTEAAAGHDAATFIPGAASNTTRRILNRILSDLLTRPHTTDERLALAQDGLAALEVSEQEIDSIGILGENVTTSVHKLESAFTLAHRNEKKELLALATRRFDIAADIRGLSYLANHHMSAIFTRVINDGGNLTNEHSESLNRQIPEVEADFDRRSALYRELEDLGKKVDTIAREAHALW